MAVKAILILILPYLNQQKYPTKTKSETSEVRKKKVPKGSRDAEREKAQMGRGEKSQTASNRPRRFHWEMPDDDFQTLEVEDEK